MPLTALMRTAKIFNLTESLHVAFYASLHYCTLAPKTFWEEYCFHKMMISLFRYVPVHGDEGMCKCFIPYWTLLGWKVLSSISFWATERTFTMQGGIFYLDRKAASEYIWNVNTLALVSTSSGSVHLEQGRPMCVLWVIWNWPTLLY